MNFYLIGIDYNRADIKTREDILKRKNEIIDFFPLTLWQSSALVTCNRFELYLSGSSKLIKNPLNDKAYFLSGKINVFRHALRLACGLESQLKGELQIFHQIGAWLKNIPLGLQELWQEVYQEAVDIRNVSDLNSPDYNIANVVYEDIRKLCGKKKLKGIIIGTGKIAELLSIYRDQSMELDFVSHKNRGRAEILAINTGGLVLSLKEIKSFLLDADFVISATKSPHFILKQDDLEDIVLQRSVPLYIYDLAIPRDVEPSVKNLPKIVFKNMDDLLFNFEAANLKIKDKLKHATYLVEEAVDGYTSRHSSKPFSFKAG